MEQDEARAAEHARAPYSVVEYDGSAEVVDANGFIIADIHYNTISRTWLDAHADSREHWGNHPGTAHVERSQEEIMATAELFAASPDLLAAAIEMDALMENLWKAVPWGKTFNLDVAALNEAPIKLKAAIARATGQP